MSHIVILDEPLCVAGAAATARRIKPVELVSCTWREAIAGDRGSLTMVLAADGPSVAQCGIFDVVRVFDKKMNRAWQYRIADLVDGPHLETVTVQAFDLSHDLGRVRFSLILGGIEQFAPTVGTLTPEQWVDLVIVALNAAGITWIIKGTITPQEPVAIGTAQTTCGAVMAALEGQTKFEWWLEPNGDTNYKIMLGRRSAAGSPFIWVGHNVKTLERQIIADEKFFNRAIAQGAAVGDEPELSGVAQHGWRIAGVTGDDVELEHPQGLTPPIGCDDQLNGLTGGVSLDGIMPPRGMGDAVSVAWDGPRQTVWWLGLRRGSLTEVDVYWHSYATGASNRIQIGGATALRSMVIDATRAELFVACEDADKVERIDLVTRASVGNIAVGVGPTTLTNLRDMGIAELAVSPAPVDISGGGDPLWETLELYSLSTLALVAVLQSENADANEHAIYDSGSSRYVRFAGGSIALYNAAYVQVGVTLDPGMAMAGAGIASGVIHIVGTAGEVRTLTVSTATLGSLGSLPAGVLPTAWLGFVAPLLSGKLYATDGGELFALDTAAAYAIVGRVPVLGGMIRYDTTDDIFVVCAGALATVLYRNGTTAPSGRLRFVVQDTDKAAQTVEKPSATKGPLVIGQQLVEFRGAADAYRSYLEDPLSVSVYGPVDGWPRFRDGYKRNYKMDPRMNEWVSDGVATRPRWLHWFTGDATNAANLGDLKWAAADAPSSRATAALVNDGGTWTVNVPDTLGIDGLPAGYVVHAGALLSYANDTALSVLNRAVANGGGAVTLDVLPLNTKVIVNNDPITVHQPAESDALGDFMLGLPMHDVVDGRWPLIAGGVHVPSIGGASQAWIRFKYLCLQFGGNRNTVTLNFSGHGSGSIAGEDVTAGTFVAPIWSSMTLAKQVALNTVPAGTDHFLGFNQAYGGVTVASRRLHVWLQSIEVYIVTAASLADVAPAGAIPGDELVPWTGSNYLLFDDLRAAPSFHYKVEFVERNGEPILVAQTARLRDPGRGIAALPRHADVEYEFAIDDREVKQPRVTLENRTPSAMEALAGVGA